MTSFKTRKTKKSPNYGFLISRDQNQAKKARVKRETKNDISNIAASNKVGKNADSLAQAEAGASVKKGITRSLITISLILILELVIYLAWIKFTK